MKKITFTLLFILIFVVNFSAQSRFNKEDYTIYGVVLNDIYNQRLKETERKSSFAILNQTIEDSDFSIYENLNIRGLGANFKARNQTPVILERRFPIKYYYAIVNVSEIEILLERGKADFEKRRKEIREKQNVEIVQRCSHWEYFYEKYQQADGYYKFSAIGFSTNRNFALLEVLGAGGCWNSNTTYILKKSKNKWKIYKAFGGYSVA